jgi:hypothetical protein
VSVYAYGTTSYKRLLTSAVYTLYTCHNCLNCETLLLVTETGEWIRYSVNVQTTGKYGINYQLAGAPPQAVALQMHIVVDSSDCKGPAGAGYVSTTQFGTGSWIGGTAYGGGDVTLTAGAHTLTVCFDQVRSETMN